ncbi:MAG: hypothetical protein LBU91_05035 [Bacteroidales bacterium]|jgi:hypothetical protein|nr:hypothetical protein [Bacteroidales bacterium]
MKAIEFKSKIRENQILIPRKIRSEFSTVNNKGVRVVIFMDDADVYEEKAYHGMAKSQFLKGYADSDSIYDL